LNSSFSTQTNYHFNKFLYLILTTAEEMVPPSTTTAATTPQQQRQKLHPRLTFASEEGGEVR
jgi:hypothetical protein